MMPHPERAVDELLGGAEGLKVFQSILKQWRKHMSLMLEPNPTQIKEERIYAEMGLTDEEFAMVEKILVVCQIIQKQDYSLLCGLNIVVIKIQNQYFENSQQQVARLASTREGAGIVDIGDNQAVVFKMESHNHPSAIEPYQGAATGVGGIIRDVFSMGARPVALLNSLRFGELQSPRVKYLFEEVVAGIAGYGNCIGIPTVGGEVQFDPCYEGNPLVNAMCVGLINHEDIKKGKRTVLEIQ